MARVVAVGIAVAALCMPPRAAAQQLEIRGVSPFAAWRLSPSLGVVEASLRKVGRGVYVRDIQPGDGIAVDTGAVVSLHYVGQLADGRTFDATDREPFSFRLGDNAVIAGWEDGVHGMRVGGRRQLVIPPHLGYGAAGQGAIPPDAVLVFDVTLIDAKQP
jgi:FKBP-type peptidyl-prolyl cis-trans isomerase